MKLDYTTYPYFIKECDEIFKKYPVFEYAIAYTIKKKIRAKPESEIKYKFLKHFLPISFLFKKYIGITGNINNLDLNKKKKYENIIKPFDEKEKHFISFFKKTRHHLFYAIYPVTKKINELGEKTIIFTSYKVYENRKKELESLRETTIFFYENLVNEIDIKNLFQSYLKSYKIFNESIKSIKNSEIKKFILKYKDEIIFKILENLIYQEAIEELLKGVKCKYLFYGGGDVPLRLFSKKRGFKSVMFQHGYYWNPDCSGTKIHNPPENAPNASDIGIMWGVHSEKNVKKNYCGLDTNTVALGSAQYDDVVKKYLNKTREKGFYKKFKIDPKKKNVVFFSSSFVSNLGMDDNYFCVEPTKIIDHLCDKLGSNINLIIKLHPSEKIDYYKNNFKNFNNVTFIKKEINVFELLQYTDISIAVASTALIESMIFNIPVLQLDLAETYGVRADYNDNNASLLVKNKEDIVKYVKGIIDGSYNLDELLKSEQKYVENNFANLGHAVDSIVDYLLK